MPLRIALAAVSIVVLLPDLAAAERVRFKVDPAHSEVSFSVRHLVSKTSGNFSDFSGEILLDPNDPSTMQLSATIAAASVDTNNDKRDGHLRSADFLDVDKHPSITFRSTRVAKTGDQWAVTGDLAIRGITKPVTLEVAILGVSPTPVFGGVRVGLEAKGRIDRQDWGVNWNRIVEGGGALLGDDVDLTIRAEAVNVLEGAQALPAAKTEKEREKEEEREAKEKAARP